MNVRIGAMGRQAGLPSTGVALLLGAALLTGALAARDADEVETGRRIYQEGVLSSGAPLVAQRAGNTTVGGAAAACVNCHRRSGMGSVEGDIQIRPITGNYLYNIGRKNMATMDPRVGKAMNQAHEAYSDETLGRAVREGVNSGGQKMNPLMPRFALGEADMKALTAYLKQLSHEWSPGVTAETIRFATVVAPGVDPARRKVFLDMLQAAVAQKNGSTLPGRRHMVSPAEMLSGTERKWTLDVWELSGEPSTWAAQLDEHYRREPVFALLSGLSETTWAPVAEFCERARVPCWFPSVDLPPAGAKPLYPVYFSRGVALEADVLASYWRTGQAERPPRVIQVYRDEAVARGGAEALAQALRGSGIEVDNRVLAASDAGALAHALRRVGTRDALMLWLRPADLQTLGRLVPPAGAVYLSERLARDEFAALPAAWKRTASLVYPYLLPQTRDANLASLHAWLKVRNLPLVDEALQSEVFFAVSSMTTTVAEMLDNLYGDYLLERAESMLSVQESMKAVDETRSRTQVGRPGELLARYEPRVSREQAAGRVVTLLTAVRGQQTGTSIYPRLSLAPGQRFASKGGCIVRFAGAAGDGLAAESEWIIP